MLDIQLAPGDHRRVWVVDIQDAATAEHVQLPPVDDWLDVIRAMNLLADMYGSHNVKLYQWDITCIATDAPIQP